MVDSRSADRFASKDICNSVPWAGFSEAKQRDIDEAVGVARPAFGKWRRTTGAERATVRRKVADPIATNVEGLAQYVASDTRATTSPSGPLGSTPKRSSTRSSCSQHGPNRAEISFLPNSKDLACL